MLYALLLLGSLAAGVLLLTKGAEYLIDGAADLARFFKVPAILIGLTVVAIGTSFPEFVVGLVATFQGHFDILTGNIIGSNIANIGLIIGFAAIAFPLVIRSETLMYEFPFVIFSSLLFIVLANNNYIFRENVLSLGRLDGIIMLITLLMFLVYVFVSARSAKKSVITEFREEYVHANKLSKNISLIVGGSFLLFFGGRLFVDSASSIARFFGISEAAIGLTVAAVGTSLPELWTAGIAAWKKEADIAVGNVLGSNVFNILFVLGFISLIHGNIPINPHILYVDSIIMITFTFLFLTFSATRLRIDRAEGVALLLGYAGYLVYTLL